MCWVNWVDFTFGFKDSKNAKNYFEQKEYTNNNPFLLVSATRVLPNTGQWNTTIGVTLLEKVGTISPDLSSAAEDKICPSPVC